MSKKKPATAEDLIGSLHDGSYYARCNALRNLCPCRNNRREIEVWREIFDRAIHGGLQERKAAAHVIGTLIDKGMRSAKWRSILHQLSDRLDNLMRNPRASRILLSQMKRHGHAHRGAAIQSYRRRRRVLDMATCAELSAWLSGLEGVDRLSPHDRGVGRLWRWLIHRAHYQPNRDTSDKELLKMASRFLPGQSARFHRLASAAESMAQGGAR